jgi:hypothetical protein
MRCEASSHARLFSDVGYKAAILDLTEVSTIWSADLVTVKPTDMPSIVCPKIIPIFVTEELAVPCPQRFHGASFLI